MNILGNIGSATKSVLRARQEHATKSVHAYLAQFDDASLARMGYNRKDLKRGGQLNFFL